jgi:aminomuconate-semialdehyde/2-hydroxymuconate-6-semialdehyde dehydrogenase
MYIIGTLCKTNIISSKVAPLIKKSAMELGGKNASVVFEDCDIDKAVQGIARSAFTNQGKIQICAVF